MTDDATKYSVRNLKWAHIQKEGWMSEFATMIEVEDEGAGEFLTLKQPFASVKLSAGGIAISPEEWPTLRAAIDAAFDEILRHNAPVLSPVGAEVSDEGTNVEGAKR